MNRALVHKFCKSLLKYRQAIKTRGTYVENYEKLIVAGGRVHPEFKITRTLTGRSSASNQNTQNMPRAYKDFFDAEAPLVYAECDWSAIEFRVAAWCAKEQSIIQRFAENPNWDPHRYFAAAFYRKPEQEITKLERQTAKSANFGLLYLGNGYTLVEYCKGQGLTISIQEADALYHLWHDVFPGFRAWYAATKKELIDTNEVRTATGFIRHYADVSIMPLHLRAGALRESVNVQVQGLSAHIAYLTLAELDRRKLPLVNFVHDSFAFEFEPSVVASRMQLVESTMVNYPRKALKELFNIDFDMPLAVESTIHASE